LHITPPPTPKKKKKKIREKRKKKKEIPFFKILLWKNAVRTGGFSKYIT
jgi:hypothetical protein